MSPVGSIPSLLQSQPGAALGGMQAIPPRLTAGTAAGAGLAPEGAPGFGSVLDGLVAQVGTKQAEASDLTRRVLLGDTDQLHQSVIAMQEASVAFSLMVEVRNKLVESYQELMRMQV